MKIIEKVKGLFKKDIAQTVNIESMANSQVIQAGRDIVINQELPADMIAILKNINENLLQNKTLDQSVEKIEVSSQACDIYAKLMERTLQEIRNLINCSQIHDAKEMIEQLIKTEGFNIIDISWQIQVYYLQGIVLLEESEFEQLESILKYINELQPDSKYSLELIYRIACSKNDEEMFEESINGFKKINVTEAEIENKMIHFLVVQEKYDAVISNLTEFDEVKEAYITNDEILYNLGIAYFNLGKYSLARKYLAQSNDISSFEYKEYLLILSEVIPILNRRGIVVLMTLEEKDILTEKLNNLLQLQGFFEVRNIKLQEEFWTHVFSIKNLINPSEVISDIQELSDSLQQADKIKYMLGEAYVLVGRKESALEIYEEIYKIFPSSEILLKIVGICYEEKDYSKVVKILSVIDYKEYKDDESIGYILKMYFSSYHKINDCDLVSKKIEELESEFPDCASLFESIAIYFYENGKIDRAKEYIEKSKGCIVKANDYTRLFLAKTCKEIDMLDDAIEVLEPFKEYAKEGLETFIEFLLESGTEENLNRAEELLNNILATGCREPKVLQMKAHIAVQNAELTEAVELFEELFEIVPNVGIACNLIATKVQSRKLNDLDKYINYITQTEDSSVLMMGALGLDAIDKPEQARDLAYKAMCLMGDTIEESTYRQYLGLYFAQIQKANTKQEVIEFDKVKKDSVVELIDLEGNKRFVCINSINDFIKEEGHFALGCEQYSSDTNLNNRLLNLKIGDHIELEGISYSVKSIINKHVHTFRYCLNRYTTTFPSSGFVKAIPVSKEDPISSLLPTLVEQRERSEYLLQQYNSLDGLGAPSTILSKDYKRYHEVIKSLLLIKDQMFYSGEVNSWDTTNGRVILSFSSIIFLKHIGFLDRVIQEKDNIYTTEKTLNKIKEIFTEVCECGENTSGTMSVDTEGGLRLFTEDDEHKEENIEFWRGIVLALESIEVIKTNDKKHKEMKRTLRNFMGDFELEPISIENCKEDILICDDLSTRKVIATLNGQLKVTNSVGIIEELCSPEELLDVLLELSKQQYIYVCNKNIILKIVEYVLSKPFIIGPGTECEKLIGIIRNMFANQLMFRSYLPMLRDVIYEVFERTMDINAYSLLEQIIREIKLSVDHLNILSAEILWYLIEPAGLEVRKSEFITKVYKES